MLTSIAQSIPFLLGLGRFTLERLKKILAALDAGLRVTLPVEARFGDDTVVANSGQQAAMAAE